jgi:Rps23 Pro-64 3,4-dihydroxylase Tpa1-like proline 4-hydroxylase
LEHYLGSAHETHPRLKADFDRCQNEFTYLSAKYSDAIAEMHNYFSELIFQELPAREGRLKLMTQLMGTQPSEAMYLLWHLHQTVSLEGDVCEFGVAVGQTSAPFSQRTT